MPLILAARQQAIVFAFTPEDVDWSQRTVRASLWRGHGLWQQKTLPLPRVVYNRLLRGRKTDFSSALQHFRRQLRNHRIPIFNWTYFNKKEIFRLLKSSGDTHAIKYLPETIDEPTPQTLERLLAKHQTVFLKPVGGFAGIGIFRMISSSSRDARLHFHHGRQARMVRFPSRVAMIRYVAGRTRGFRKHIAQQGIALLRHLDCPVDFRVHMNRNRAGQWAISGIGAKKAGKGSVTTHLRTGGSVYHPLHLLRRAFPEQAEQLLQRLRSTSSELAAAIAKQSPHLIGEIGFDMGIDQKGRIWMFEANAKPGRSIFKHPALRGAMQRCYRHIMDYCLYLSEQRNGGASP